MKLPIALVLAGLSIVSSVAYGASPEHATPKSIVASQADALSVLPEQYKSYATKMNTVVKDTKHGYTFTIPWRVNDGVMIDMYGVKVNIYRGIPLICLDQIKTTPIPCLLQREIIHRKAMCHKRCGIQHGMMFQLRV